MNGECNVNWYCSVMLVVIIYIYNYIIIILLYNIYNVYKPMAGRRTTYKI